MLCLDLMYLHYFKNYSGLVCVKRKQSYCTTDLALPDTQELAERLSRLHARDTSDDAAELR